MIQLKKLINGNPKQCCEEWYKLAVVRVLGNVDSSKDLIDYQRRTK